MLTFLQICPKKIEINCRCQNLHVVPRTSKVTLLTYELTEVVGVDIKHDRARHDALAQLEERVQ